MELVSEVFLDPILVSKGGAVMVSWGFQSGHAVASGLWAAGMISIILSYLIVSYHHHHHHHHHHPPRRRRRRRRLQGNSR